MSGKVYDITAVSNPRIKSIKTLWRKKNRNETKKFLGEGQKIVKEAMKQKWEVDTFICLKGDKDNETLAAQLKQTGSDVLFVNKNILAKITNRENAANCLSVIKQKIRSINEVKIEENENWLALDRVRDTGNLGTTIRTADAMGVKGLILIGECADIFAMETVRASMGALFSVPIFHVGEEEFVEWVKKDDKQIIATHLNAEKYHDQIQYEDKCNVIIMGNEQKGVSDKLNECANVSVKIKMRENADSLNLAVATGIVLFQAQKDKIK